MFTKQTMLYSLTVVVVSFFLVIPAGCSKEESQQAEKKGRIDKMTNEAAETAVRKIRTPKDKARATRDLGNDRLENIDKAVQQQ